MKNKLLALLLCIITIFSVMQTAAFADGEAPLPTGAEPTAGLQFT